MRATVDLRKLLEQKVTLLRLMDKANKRDQETLEGLLNMLDAIQDALDPPARSTAQRTITLTQKEG